MEEEIMKIDKKKYWLKLDKNFLKSSQMKVIRTMPNGKDYIIFYLSLMLESIETVGHLRFTSLVPYNDEMLAAVTDTNIDIVRSAVKIFCELGLMKIFDDGTIFLPEVPPITGKESESAERVRNYRKRLKEKEDLLALQCNSDVTNCNDNKDKDKKEEEEKEKKKELEKEFEEVWSIYPKKQGRSKAIEYYIKARKDNVSKETIIEAIEKYKKYVDSIEWLQYKNGSTWFNQKCWNDDYSIEGGGTNNEQYRGDTKETKPVIERDRGLF